uniref:Uncharacterized protein n=1 Tax=Globisporangium ultimum (strain ATCC 200006 / CBS 805.95 / DAOM BR144) TaxID=431595 RepID=K3W9F5_GLOUD
MPFDFQSVCDVIWQCFRNEAVSGSEPGDDVVLPTEDNLVFTKKTIAMESSSDQGRREIKLSIRVITKRFVSKDRMVLCSEGKTTWPRGVIEGTDGLQMREKSWIVVKPMPSSGSMRMCVTQQCTHMSPSDGAGAVLAFPEQMNKVKMSVIPKYQQIIGGYYQCIENSLLDKQVVTTRLVL